jgi:hypothetical protein
MACAIGHAGVSRLAFPRDARPGRGVGQHRLRDLARIAGKLGAQLSRLRAVRPRSVHLFGQGSEGGRARAQHGRVREGQGSGVLAARAPAEHGARGHRQDFGEDGAPRVRSDPAHARFRRRPPCVGARRPAPDAPPPQGHHPRMEHSEEDRQDIHGLQYERPRQDAQRCLFAAGRAWGTGVDAAYVGRARRRASARFHDRECAAVVGPKGRSRETRRNQTQEAAWLHDRLRV